MVLPLSGMGSWAVVVSGALMSLHVLGINLAPLLTVGMIPARLHSLCYPEHLSYLCGVACY